MVSLIKFVALFMVGLSARMVGPMMAYSPMFTGTLQYLVFMSSIIGICSLNFSDLKD